MLGMLIVWFAACDGGKGDSAGAHPSTDDSATDDSGTNVPDDSGTVDDSGDDSGTECTKLDWYLDGDGDGYGAGTATSACDAPATGWITTNGDCDDALADVNPDAAEVCNGIDDDCDIDIDDADESVVSITWYTDADDDGFGDPKGASITSCTGAGGYAPDDAKHPPDCDDADDTVYPGASELCDDLQQDCNTTGWSGDVAVATWYPNAGGSEDWTADLAAGKYGAAARIAIPDDGELAICDGTWYASLDVTGTDVRITGLHGSADTIISGGDDGRPLGVFTDGAVVTATGLTLTEGNACYGAAVSTALVDSCSKGGASAGWSSDISLTLSDVRIEENAPTLPATAAVVVAQGTMFTLENSTISNNSVWAVWAVENPVTCTGDLKSDAGIWGNQWGGISILSRDKAGAAPLIFESDGCDFEGSGLYTPPWDVQLQNLEGTTEFGYGEDAVFLCDANSRLCSK